MQKRKILKFGLIAILSLLTVLAIAFFSFAPTYADSKYNRVNNNIEPIASSAKELHQSLLVADLHADSLLWGRDLSVRSQEGHVDIPRLIEGNVALEGDINNLDRLYESGFRMIGLAHFFYN